MAIHRGPDGFPLQYVSNAEIVSMPRRHHKRWLHMGVKRRFISLAPPLFIQQTILPASNNEETKAPLCLSSVKVPSNTNELPLHGTRNVESVPVPWRHLERWQPFFISFVVARWLIRANKLGGLWFKQLHGVLFGDGDRRQLTWSMLSVIITVKHGYVISASMRPISPKFDCLFNSLFDLITKKMSRHRFTAPLWGGCLVTGGLEDSHYKGPAMRKVFPCHGVVMRNGKL